METPTDDEANEKNTTPWRRMTVIMSNVDDDFRREFGGHDVNEFK